MKENVYADTTPATVVGVQCVSRKDYMYFKLYELVICFKFHIPPHFFLNWSEKVPILILKVLAMIPYFNFHFFPHLLIFLQFRDPSYTVKTPVLKLTPAGVNTGPISNGVNLTPFWCYFNTFWCFSSPVGVISTPKSVEITPKWC